MSQHSSSSCCGCITTKSGILVIGVLSLLWDVLCGGYGLVTVDMFADSVSRRGWIGGGLEVTVGAILLTRGVIGIITSCCLICGVRRRSPCLIKPWVIGSSIGIVLMLIASTIVIASGGYGPRDTSTSILVHGSNTLELIIRACFILVVNRFSVQLEEELAQAHDRVQLVLE